MVRPRVSRTVLLLAPLAIFVLVAATAATARADAIGPCPEGQHVVMNPASPGSMHHGGFHCENDPGRCSVAAVGASGHRARPSALWLAGAAALLASRRRSRWTRWGRTSTSRSPRAARSGTPEAWIG